MGKRGERFRRARERAGLTQGQVATYAETMQGYLSQIERDQRWPTTWHLIERLATLYQVSIDYLFGLVDDPIALYRPMPRVDVSVMKDPGIDYRTVPVEPRVLLLLREMSVNEQLDLLESLELYRRMNSDQRAAVDHIMRQFVDLNTPRIIGGLPDPDE